jgi:hypothetical protein
MTETTGSTSAKDQARAAAGTAADEGRHVAGVAAGEASSVAGEAKSHAKGLLDEALVQVEHQTRTQRDRVADTLATFSDDLEKMASSSDAGGLAVDLAHQAADRARALGRHLDGREPSDLLDDVRRFARNRPGVFLVGALVAGVAAGRLARGAKDASSTSTEDTTPAYMTPVAPATTGVYPTTTGTTPGMTPGTMPGDAGYSSDPYGVDSPAVGTSVPPTSVGRYEP